MEWAKTRSQARFNLASSGVAELPMAEWKALRPERRHHLQQRVWTAGAEDAVAALKPRCLARRICALIFFWATGCGRGFARP